MDALLKRVAERRRVSDHNSLDAVFAIVNRYFDDGAPVGCNAVGAPMVALHQRPDGAPSVHLLCSPHGQGVQLRRR
jgi:hypothetical protein